MSTKTACQRIVFSNVDFIIKNVVPFVLGALVIRGIVHELAHGIVNGLTGGTFGFTSDAGNLIGGYSIHKFYVIEPALSIHTVEAGNELAMLIAGPASIFVLFWIVAHYYNPVALRASSTCHGNNTWMVARGWVYGLWVGAVMDSLYILPLSPFPEVHWGDGLAIYNEFKEMGWHWEGTIDLFGLPVAYLFNPGYLVGAVAIIGTLYYTLLIWGVDVRGLPSRLIGCTFPSNQRCKI